MSVLQKIRAELKQFHNKHRDEQPIIRIDKSTELEFMELTANEIGSEAVGAVFTHGPQALSSVYGVRILWNAARFEVVPAYSEHLDKWKEQEVQMRNQGIPRIGAKKG